MEQPPTDENWPILPAALDDKDQRQSVSRREIRGRALVLAARMIPHVIDRSASTPQLRVPPAYYAEALRQLRLHSRENRNWPPPPPALPAAEENYLSTLVVLALLVLFHNLTLQHITIGPHLIHWNSLGSADAGLIIQGEWWRTVTALTLHADVSHLLGNIIIGGFFMLWLGREFGGGLGWFLCLTTGSSGNLINAWLQHPEHRSIGASTAVFGVLALAASYNFLRYRHHLGRRQLAPLAAACGLLALLGVGEATTDIGAHLFGFAVGLLAGVIMHVVLKYYARPGRSINTALGMLSVAVVIFSWLQAINS